jgi:hypothetical protein
MRERRFTIHAAALLALLMAALWPRCARTQDITSNLRGLWKLTETSGTTAMDASSTPHNGTYMNGVALAASTACPVDGAVSAKFDGTNDYVTVGTESYFDITGAITVAAWVKVTSWTVSNQAIITKGDGAWQLARDGFNSGVRFTCTGLWTSSVATTIAINDGKWHHIVGQYGSGYLIIYVDGVLNNYTTTGGWISTNNYPVEIGRSAQTASRYFNGAIYEARVYDRMLSATDVSYLALQGGPVGKWDFNQTSGTTITDSSIFGNDGALTGTASWTTRCNGTGVFDFDGSTKYVTVSNAAQLQPWGALTIAGWIRGDSWGSGSDVDTIARKGDATPNNYALSIADGKVELLLDDSDTAGVRGNTTLSTGAWYHVAATWDGSTAKIYVNGVLDNTPVSRTAMLGTDTRALYLGGRMGSTDMFNGQIQNVAVYNRALSQAEIARLAGMPGKWAFSEGTGTTAADTSGGGNNATLSGGAAWTTDCSGNKALLTNGSGGIAATNSAFTPPSEGTVAFWMQASTGSGTRRIFGLGGDWEVRQLDDGTVVFDLCGDGGTTTVSTTVPLQANRWYHVAETFNSADDSFAIYIDGVLHRSGINTVNMVQQPAGVLSFGTRTGTSEYWGGALRDFRIYSRRLCPTEIAQLSGLEAYWKLDETTGTTANDSSPWGRNGAVTGTATWTTGKVANALQLNGSTYVTISGLAGNPKNVTLAAWAQLTGAGSSGAEVVSLGDCFAIRLNEGTTSRAFFYNGTTWQGANVSQTFTGAGWKHFAAVFDDDNNILRFYINGTQASSLSTTSSISYSGLGANIMLGRHGNGQTAFNFTGKLDDVRIYSRALCPEAIQDIVNEGGGVFQGVKILQWVETR